MTKTLTIGFGYAGAEIPVMEHLTHMESQWERVKKYPENDFPKRVLLGDLGMVIDHIHNNMEVYQPTEELERARKLCEEMGHLDNPISDYCPICSDSRVHGTYL